MKQTYIAPQMEVVEIGEETLMLTASGEGSLPDTDSADQPGKNMDADANGRRGSWGNLWEDGRRW